MVKILVTGGLGFIGSHLLEKLNDLNYLTTVID
ncbi:NAD-dependent epimerase/dehydratase family protein, partial [Microgenomates group bacterium]|nr:NAD-dependent epimerase/dehydratase family protein [Microgenomates group bacterium]